MSTESPPERPGESATVARRACAIAAARRVLATHGMGADRVEVLQDSNHTVLHLVSAGLVAKVGTSPEEASLADEVRVAGFLVQRGGPAVSPARRIPAGPHLVDGLELTLWEYYPPAGGEPPVGELGRSLRTLHAALAEYPGVLRPWDRFDGVADRLANPTALQALPPQDRTFLRTTFAELQEEVALARPVPRPLHGEPHAANLLLGPQGPRWIDFESACLGPQEWDLTVLPDGVVREHFHQVDWPLLATLRRLRSLCVAVWCWLDPDRAPVLRRAGEYHLGALKGQTR